jgi:hypothetical protein
LLAVGHDAARRKSAELMQVERERFAHDAGRCLASAVCNRFNRFCELGRDPRINAAGESGLAHVVSSLSLLFGQMVTPDDELPRVADSAAGYFADPMVGIGKTVVRRVEGLDALAARIIALGFVDGRACRVNVVIGRI